MGQGKAKEATRLISDGGSTWGIFFKETYVQLKVDKWKEELQSLVEIAATQPQAAYAALIVSIKNKWSYLARTTETIGHLLQPIEDVLRHDLNPAITGRQAMNDAERRMFALPTQRGGLGIEILPEVADQLYSNSRKVTEPLKNSIRGREEMDESHTDAEFSNLARPKYTRPKYDRQSTYTAQHFHCTTRHVDGHNILSSSVLRC